MMRLVRLMGSRDAITSIVEVAGLVLIVVAIGMLTAPAWALLAAGVLALGAGYWTSR